MMSLAYVVAMCYALAATIVACATAAPVMLGFIPRPKAAQLATWIGWIAVLVCLAACLTNLAEGR